jgi:two-component sensor histidine kinase
MSAMSAGPRVEGAIARGGEPLTIVAEITHRVLNEYTHAIAGLNRAAAHASDPGSRTSLSDAADRLRAYAEAHRTLQAPLARGPMDLGGYLESICRALSAASLADRQVRLSLSMEPVALEAERGWRVGLIVAELINNAVRHAFGGRGGAVRVEVCARGDLVLCRVSDDGGSDVPARPGRGSAVIEGLAAELGGQVEWRFGRGGATALLSFPLTSPHR